MGLAAARIGWMYAPAHVADAVNRIRGPFNLNIVAQTAGAEAARDTAFTAMLKAHNALWRKWLTNELSSNHIRVVPSQANFILALFPDEAAARAAFTALMAKGLIVREVGVYGIPNGLRISIGSEEAMRGVAAVLKDFGGR
jgi:histidinol-phosphate aminotransferase